MNLHDYLQSDGALSPKELAKLIGLDKPKGDVLISQWKTCVRRVPAERCPAIELATAGAVTCEDLRPDVAWSVLRNGTALSRRDAA